MKILDIISAKLIIHNKPELKYSLVIGSIKEKSTLSKNKETEQIDLQIVIF